jgi:hypothetical protein
VFEVVEDQEKALAGEMRHERVAQGLVVPFSDSESLRDCGSHQGRISHWRERSEDHAIGKRRRYLLRDGEREAGLAGATWSRQGEQPNCGLS